MKPTVSPLNFLATIRPDSFTLLLAALAVVGAAFILASQANYGVGMSGDSAAYVSAARNLLSGNGLLQWDGAIYQDYAPLFPVLLAATGVFGHDLAGYLNAAAFGLTIFVSVMWLRGRVHSRFLVVWATVALVLSLPLVYVSTKALSEPLFILFTVLALFAINKFLASGHRSAFFLAAVFTALACLSRYIGVALVAVILLLLLLQRDAPLRERAQHAALYFVIAIAPLCLWLLRNFLHTGVLTGHGNYDPQNSLLFNIKSGLVVLLR